MLFSSTNGIYSNSQLVIGQLLPCRPHKHGMCAHICNALQAGHSLPLLQLSSFIIYNKISFQSTFRSWTKMPILSLDGQSFSGFQGHLKLLPRKHTEISKQHVGPSASTSETSTCSHKMININPLNPKLNPICYLLALLAHHFLHVSRIRVKSLTLRLLMSYIYIYIYIYGAPILDVSRSHTTTQHSR